MTNIINCSLGMIIFPCEFEKKRRNKKSLWRQPAKDIIKRIGCRVYKFQPIKRARRGIAIHYTDAEKTFEILLAKIRNGLAHQRIRPKNTGIYWDRIVISNQYDHGGVKEIDVNIEFTQEQLKQLALLITNEYTKK